jgi:VIT1/CCC1 family predicted Fe2+/Mn2+ transporter
VPWFFRSGLSAQIASLLLAAVASVGIGALLARLSGRPLLWPALRQLFIVALAAGATVGVGRIFRVPVS